MSIYWWNLEISNNYWRIDNFSDEYFAPFNNIVNKTVWFPKIKNKWIKTYLYYEQKKSTEREGVYSYAEQCIAKWIMVNRFAEIALCQ